LFLRAMTEGPKYAGGGHIRKSDACGQYQHHGQQNGHRYHESVQLWPAYSEMMLQPARDAISRL
jgi:hypothetical protein